MIISNRRGKLVDPQEMEVDKAVGELEREKQSDMPAKEPPNKQDKTSTTMEYARGIEKTRDVTKE